MRPLRKFKQFLKQGIVRKQSPDYSRAKDLIQESENRKEFLENLLDKIGISDENANYFVEAVYDILISLMRAKLLKDGYISSGKGAHEAEVSYMLELGFSEPETRFMNNLRYFRNGIKYYGKNFDKEYAEKVIDYLNKIYPRLKKLL